MTKYEFMYELEKLLQDISDDERETALRYYEDYFADAGRENEQDIIKQLESPKKVAETIKKDFSLQNGREEGYFTENGFMEKMEESSDLPVEHIEIEDREDTFQFENNFEDQKENRKCDSNTKSGGNIILWILLTIFLLIPVGLPLAASLFAFLIGAAGILFGLAIAVIVMSGAFLIAGVICVIAGIARMTVIPMNGAITAGVGCVLLGIGTLCTLFSVWFCGKVIPAVINGCTSLFRRLFIRKEAKA